MTRINELQQQIALLANLRPAAGAVVSCYLDLSHDKSTLQTFVRNRLGAGFARVPGASRGALDACIDVIEAQLESDLPSRTRGLAIFAAAEGKTPLLAAMPFAEIPWPMPADQPIAVTAGSNLHRPLRPTCSPTIDPGIRQLETPYQSLSYPILRSG